MCCCGACSDGTGPVGCGLGVSVKESCLAVGRLGGSEQRTVEFGLFLARLPTPTMACLVDAGVCVRGLQRASALSRPVRET